MTWSDFVLIVQDRLHDDNIGNDLEAVIIRASNRALRRINRGEISNEKRVRRVGYDFQKQTTSVTYDADTLEYNFTTLGITVADFKFAWDMRINSDENRAFEFIEPTNLRYKRGVLGSRSSVFALDNDGATKQLLIYNGNDDTLDFEWYSNYMVLDSSSRKVNVPTDVANVTFLMPDEFVESPLADYTAAYILRDYESSNSERASGLFNDGDNGLLSMRESIGVLEKKPATKIKIHSEWNQTQTRITKR